MDQVMELLQRLAPEEVAAMEQRYEILSAISLKGPIGRRSLSGANSAQERSERHHCEVLRAEGLIEAAQEGMRATQAGERVLLSLGPMMRSLTGTGRMAAQLSRLLRVEHVVIQAGAVADDELRKRELCHTAAQYVSRWLTGAHPLAILGGTTMPQLAQQKPQGNYPELIVLPARGGMGERVEMQANLVAAQMAGRLNAQYRMLHLPDDVNAGTMERLMERASIAEVVAMIRQPDILIYSIGRADELMQRRGLAKQARRMLEAKGAVAEALGMYFDREGRSLLSASAVGPDLTRLAAIPRTVAVAGGAHKAEAILAAVRATHPSALFLDESAAAAMLEILRARQPL